MDQQQKKKITKGLKFTAVGAGAAAIGYVQGLGVEKLIADQIILAIKTGDFTRIVIYALIFFVIWLEVRGLKKQFQVLNETIANSFAAGEERFKTIETDVHQIREDLDMFKQQLTPSGV